jgi:hypothetical protein
LSIALSAGAGDLLFFSFFSVVVGGFVEIIDQFLFLVLFVADTEFEFSLLGPQHD